MFLAGHNLAEAASLLDPPATSEPGLAALLQAFDRLIEAAR